MSISPISGLFSAQQGASSSSAVDAAKKSDDVDQMANVPVKGTENTASSVTLAQDPQLIAPPEANGNVDAVLSTRSTAETVILAALSNAPAEGAAEDVSIADVRDATLRDDKAKQAYDEAMRGPIAALSEIAAGPDPTQQDPFATDGTMPTSLSMVA